MKKRRIVAALLSAALVTALGCSTAFAAQPRYVERVVNLFYPYTRYYSNNYGDTSTNYSDSWMMMQYVRGSFAPGSDAAARTAVSTAPGIQGFAYAKAINSIGATKGSSVTKSDYSGWVYCNWNQGLLNGTDQDDTCVKVNHCGTRIGSGLDQYYDVYYSTT